MAIGSASQSVSYAIYGAYYYLFLLSKDVDLESGRFGMWAWLDRKTEICSRYGYWLLASHLAINLNPSIVRTHIVSMYLFLGLVMHRQKPNS